MIRNGATPSRDSPGGDAPWAPETVGPGTSLDERMLGFSPKALWVALRRETLSFWFLCLYLMVEYVRPQQVWRSVDLIPWGEVTLGLTLAAYVLEGARPRRWTSLDRYFLIFIAVVLMSSLTAQYPERSLETLPTFLNWIVLYYLVSHIVHTPRRLFLFLGFFMLWSLKMSQHGTRSLVGRGFSFEAWGATGAPGWFQNSGEFAVQMAIFLPLSFHIVLAVREHLKPWQFYGLLALLPGTALASLIASSSRGGQLAGVVVILFMIFQARFRLKEMVMAVAVLGVIGLAIPDRQWDRFREMGDDPDSQRRLTYWEDGIEIMNDYPVLGIGYENWLPYYRRRYSPTGEVSHNIFVEAGSQMGYMGLGALLLLIFGTFQLNLHSRRRARAVPGWGGYLRGVALGLDGALVGFMASGFFVTVLFYPFLWVNLAFTATLYCVVRSREVRAVSSRRGRYDAGIEPAAAAGPVGVVGWRGA